ncbi:MAG TPA: hypothetical protein VFB76_13040 [Candidatus Angelobacter sp.]|nr:hypothetical protein [Candidatus Angelobacter sp.]
MKSINSRPLIFHRGPRLVPLALVYTALAIAGVISAVILRHGAPFVTPYGHPAEIQRFFAASPTAVQVSAFFLFGSAVPLGIFTATIVSQLRFLGVRAAGTYITLFGGFLASFALVLSGLSMWVLSVPDVVTTPGLAHAFYFFSFLFGGAAFSVGFGLLAAGVSVTAGITRRLSRPVVIFGFVIAVAGELSALSLLFYPASFLLPLTRYVGIVWLILAAAKLPRSREVRPAVPQQEVQSA